MKTGLFKIGAAALVASGLIAGAAGAAEEMRCSHQLPPAHPVAQVIERWGAEIETLTKGEIDVQIFPADSLVGAKENILSVARGDIECAFSVQFQWGKTLPIMTVTSRPFAFSDLNIWRNWDGSEAANFLEAKLRDKGVENVVWVFQANDAIFSSNGRFLKSPEDFHGIKFRGLGPAFNAGLDAIGASPVAMSGGEVYQALATGVVDGAMTGVDSAVSRKFFEVQDHFVVVPVISVYFHGYVNPKFYAGLSDETKAAFEEAGAKAAQWAVDTAEAGREKYPAELESKGVAVYRLTDEENAAFARLMQPAWDKVFGGTSPDSDKLLALIDKLRSE